MNGVLLALCLVPQGGPDDALNRLQAMTAERQAEVVEILESVLRSDSDPAIRRIVSLDRGYQNYPEVEPRTAHDPKVWARGVAPDRVLVPIGSRAHDELRKRVPPIAILPDLHKAVFYDWGTARVVRRSEPLTPAEYVGNCLNGYPPGSDAALAEVLAILDRNEEQKAVSAYLDHLYAELDARVYEGVTIYEAWYSEQVLDVPDVDAIPFARQILKTRAYRSPIPAGRRRTELYQKVSEAAFSNRIYRTTREAAAAAFVSAEPKMDPTYARLAPRFHYLYTTVDNDPEKLAELIEAAPDRQALLQQADAAIEGNPMAYKAQQDFKRSLSRMRAKLHRLVGLALDDG